MVHYEVHGHSLALQMGTGHQRLTCFRPATLGTQLSRCNHSCLQRGAPLRKGRNVEEKADDLPPAVDSGLSGVIHPEEKEEEVVEEPPPPTPPAPEPEMDLLNFDDPDEPAAAVSRQQRCHLCAAVSVLIVEWRSCTGYCRALPPDDMPTACPRVLNVCATPREPAGTM